MTARQRRADLVATASRRAWERPGRLSSAIVGVHESAVARALHTTWNATQSDEPQSVLIRHERVMNPVARHRRPPYSKESSAPRFSLHNL